MPFISNQSQEPPQQGLAPQQSTPYAIYNAIPGLSGLTSSATGIIRNALNGLPSPSTSRLANAYFGAGSGLDPTSDFLRNRGFDLYKTQANQQQQQGLGNLMNLIGTYSGNVAPTPGQEISNATQNRQITSSENQFNANMNFEQQQWAKQLELLGQYLNPAGGSGNAYFNNGIKVY